MTENENKQSEKNLFQEHIDEAKGLGQSVRDDNARNLRDQIDMLASSHTSGSQGDSHQGGDSQPTGQLDTSSGKEAE